MTEEQIKNLSRDQKFLLHDLINEKRRREREHRAVYSPNPGQLEVHTSKMQTRAVFSGNGGGKTTLGVNEVIWAGQGFNPITEEFYPTPNTSLIILDLPDKVHNLYIPELMKWMNLKEDMLLKHGKPYINEILWPTGSRTLFMFHDQGPLAFESISVDGLILFDEPPPRRVWISLKRAGRVKNRRTKYLLVGTPITQSWMRREIFEPWSKGEMPDVSCHKFSTRVNEGNLADGYIESFSRVLSEKERAIRIEGEFFDLDGLALAHLFDRKTHVIPAFAWEKEWPVVVAIDPHPHKAHYAVMLGCHPEHGLFYIKEIREKLIARDFAHRLKDFIQSYRVVDIVSDSLGSSELTGGEGFKSFIQVLREEGIQVRSTNWEEKSDTDFIERMRDVLTGKALGDPPRLRIFAGNWGIIGDLEHVQWKKHRDIDESKPALEISNRDWLSCLKYALATNLTIEKAKAKIYRSIATAETYGIHKTKSTGYWRDKLTGQGVTGPASAAPKRWFGARRKSRSTDDDDF